MRVKTLKLGIVFLSCCLVSAVAYGAPILENFDKRTAGKSLATDWLGGFYGSKGSPVWKVEFDKDAPSSPHVLKQSGNAVYSWLVMQDVSRNNGSVEAKIRVASGKDDPEAGIIWRFVDGKNYYYVRANAIENNIVVYKMVGGKKVSLKSVDYTVGNIWHTIRVAFKASSIAVKFDGKEILSLQDSTFNSSGRAGLFTTADTVALFDDFVFDDK